MHQHLRSCRRLSANGFTLTELMVAAAMGLLVALVAGDAMVSHARSAARAEALQRQREDWGRATSFIESEIAMSQRVITNSASVQIPTACGLSTSEFRMALDIRRDLPLIIYGVRGLSANERDLWLPDQVLIRCGPSIGSGAPILGQSGNNDYLSGASLVASVLVDGLDQQAAGGGFQITSSSNPTKSAFFTLALKGVRSTYSFGAGTFSRINPVASYPETLSTCDRACDATGTCRDVVGGYFWKGGWVNGPTADTFDIPDGAVDDNDNTMMCGLGGQDTLSGTQANDVIDAGNYPLPPVSGQAFPPGAVINGGSAGRNYLFGTPGNDTFTGGDGDDTMVGRGGGDTMLGGLGTNSYLPWLDNVAGNGNATIIGSSTGLDVVYLRGYKRDFTGVTSSCTNPCTISQGGKSLTMTNVDVLVFRDGRVDLN